MGFLKNIGKSLKGVTKMVSLKNVVKVATGNASGLATEALGRVASPHVKGINPNSTTVKMAETFVQNKSNQLSDQIVNAAANNKDFQGIAKFGTKLYFQTMWQQHKTKILIGLAVLTLGIVYFVRRGKGKPKR